VTLSGFPSVFGDIKHYRIKEQPKQRIFVTFNVNVLLLRFLMGVLLCSFDDVAIRHIIQIIRQLDVICGLCVNHCEQF